jgi:hypothetical protein
LIPGQPWNTFMDTSTHGSSQLFPTHSANRNIRRSGSQHATGSCCAQLGDPVIPVLHECPHPPLHQALPSPPLPALLAVSTYPYVFIYSGNKFFCTTWYPLASYCPCLLPLLSVSYSSLIAVFCSRAPAVSGKDKPNYRPQEEGWPEANTSLGLLCFL